jgi:hypothetical protein
MGRHDTRDARGATATGRATAEQPPEHGRRRVPVLAGLVAVGLLAVGGAAGRAWVDERTTTPLPTCTPEATTRVVVAADPTIAEPLSEALDGVGDRPQESGLCVSAVVVPQDPLQTASELSTLPAQQLPDLWVPDSSTWPDRVAPRSLGDDVPLLSAGSLATSPLVVAAAPGTVAELGWGATAPTWEEALTSGRPVALPDLGGSAAGVSALIALRQSVLAQSPEGQGPVQLQAALTTVANAIDAAAVPSLDDGFELAKQAGPQSPLVPTSEQQWFLRTRGTSTPATVAIRPRDGSMLLDYPLIRVDRTAVGQQTVAVETIVRVLEEEGRQRARAWGFSLPTEEPAPTATPGPVAALQVLPDASPTPVGQPGSAPATPPDSAPSTTPPAAEPLVLPPPTAEQVDVLLADLTRLSRPARALLLVDASVSMRAPTGTGTRATLARDAVKSSLALFADSASVGLWFFAVGMGPRGQDHTEVVPLRPLTADAGGVSQRAAILAGTDTLSERLTAGGTGLNDSVLAAVRGVRENYDPNASNSVVVITDGRNDDADGIDVDTLVATLQAEADPQRPVRVIAVGLADDSDVVALRAIAETTGGAPYLAERPEDFQTVLFDALRRRT